MGPSENSSWANFGKQNWRRPPSCVDSKRLRVYIQNVPAHMLKSMCSCCRHTRRRFECTHGGVFESTHGVFQRATQHKHNNEPHQQPPPQQHTETETEEREKDKTREKRRQDERDEKMKDKTGEDESEDERQ